MMRPAVEFGDIELWLTTWLRPQLAAFDPFVSNILKTNAKAFAVIVRDDSGADHLVTADRRVGIRCIGTNPQRTGALARRVAALMRQAAQPDTGNPVGAVGQVYGPYRVEATNSDQTEYYLTAELVVVGVPY